MAQYVPSTFGPPSNHVVTSDDTRKSAAPFHPSIWGDKFLAYSNPSVAKTDFDRKEEERLQQLKQEVRKMLIPGDTPLPGLISLIDDIQRLGISYHFEAELNTLIHHIMDSFQDNCCGKNDDALHDVALCFRLLRQEGHNVSSDVFYQFKDSNGKFNDNLVKDVKGMLSLFEATHLRVHGEDVLEDALEFTTSYLEQHLIHSNMKNPLEKLVGRALKYPLRRSLNRVVARHYISIYHEFDTHNQMLLDLAKLDFNRVQKLHQVELGHITRWWKDLDFANKLSFARDRVVEGYFWVMGVYFEPQYATARKFLTKVISLTSIVDDMYDVHGTREELEQLTNAVEKWDASSIDQLPEYMKLCYQSLLQVYDEAEAEMAEAGRPLYGLSYAKEAFKRLTRAYFEEAKWCHAGYFPNFDEYMSVALVSAGYRMLSVTSFVMMGNVASKEAFDWISKDPLIVRASSVITRLSDDIVGHEFEKQRQHIPSAVECFMKQYGVPKDIAYHALQKRILNAWKDTNEECLRPTAAPMLLLTRIFNLACVIDLLYVDGEDGYTHSSTKTKNLIALILLDPIPA